MRRLSSNAVLINELEVDVELCSAALESFSSSLKEMPEPPILLHNYARAHAAYLDLPTMCRALESAVNSGLAKEAVKFLVDSPEAPPGWSDVDACPAYNQKCAFVGIGLPYGYPAGLDPESYVG